MTAHCLIALLSQRKTLTLSVVPADTEEAVKLLIQGQEGIPWERQAMIYAGRGMGYKNRMLAEYGIDHESTVHLLIRQPPSEPCSPVGS